MQIELATIEKVTNENGQHNFRKKDTTILHLKEYLKQGYVFDPVYGLLVSNIWFDEVSIWNKYSRVEYNVFGFDGIIYLEPPIKTNGVYPYSVKADCYKFSSDGDLLEVTKNVRVSIWGKK